MVGNKVGDNTKNHDSVHTLLASGLHFLHFTSAIYYLHRKSLIYIYLPQPSLLQVACRSTHWWWCLQGREGQHWLASLSQKPKGHEGFLRNHLFTSSPLWYLSLISAAMCCPFERTLHNTLPCDNPCSHYLVSYVLQQWSNLPYYYLRIQWFIFCWSENFLETTESIFKYSKSLYLYQHISSESTHALSQVYLVINI